MRARTHAKRNAKVDVKPRQTILKQSLGVQKKKKEKLREGYTEAR